MAAICAGVAVTGCGSGDASPNVTPAAPIQPNALSCDDSMKAAFRPDENTTILLVKAFKAGEPVALSGTPTTPAPTVAPYDLCVVKLNIGPGNPGPENAPSTSPGIGVEVWLPSKAVWSGRIRFHGTGGWSGYPRVRDVTQIGGELTNEALEAVLDDQSVGAINDGGHVGSSVDGSFAMNPDGSINSALWNDFASRADHETALKVKALVSAFYLTAEKYSYFQGCSGGGREGYAAVQNYPEDYSGVLVGSPAINWSTFLTNDVYPQVIAQRDLGGVGLTTAQLDLVSASAVSACDTTLTGQHDGYINDPTQCLYDPAKDAAVLCTSAGGTNGTSACLSATQAKAVNKYWYGQTVDGSVPERSVDNGHATRLASGQLWYGVNPGADLAGLAGPMAFPIGTAQLALELQNPLLGSTGLFTNATGNGADAWKTMSYADLANASYQGRALQKAFGNVDSNNPDLTAFRSKGGKLIAYHGEADWVIPMSGTTNYYVKSSDIDGGLNETRKFHRFFRIPGEAHCSGRAKDGIAGVSPPANPPVSITGNYAPEMFTALKNWVEKGDAPDSIVLATADKTRTRPVCPYPQKLAYKGSGDVNVASNFFCQ